MIVTGNPQSAWCISGEVSASRALALIACLRGLTHFGSGSLPYVADRSSLLNPFPDTTDHISAVIAFYAKSLSHATGKGYVPPSLSYLARWWFDVSSMAHHVIFCSIQFTPPVAFSQASCGLQRGLYLMLELLALRTKRRFPWWTGGNILVKFFLVFCCDR